MAKPDGSRIVNFFQKRKVITVSNWREKGQKVFSDYQPLLKRGQKIWQESRWLTSTILAQYVLSRFQRPAFLQGICCRILKRICTNVLNVIYLLAKLITWRLTFQLTVERNPNATSHLAQLILWRVTFQFTVKRRSTNVPNVTNLLAELVLSRFTF